MTTPKVVEAHGLSWDEYQQIIQLIGRTPNLVELGIFSVMWSEHCSYKSSKIHLKKLPTEAPWVVCGPGENAGVVDIGGGMVAIFKMESHNHPSFIEPFQGADHRRRRHPARHLHHGCQAGGPPGRAALRLDPDHPSAPAISWPASCAGVGAYGNCVGVPTVGGECTVPSEPIDGNILVNAMCVGDRTCKDKVFLRQRRLASATRSSMSAPRPGATASTGPAWPRPSSRVLTARKSRPDRPGRRPLHARNC